MKSFKKCLFWLFCFYNLFYFASSASDEDVTFFLLQSTYDNIKLSYSFDEVLKRFPIIENVFFINRTFDTNLNSFELDYNFAKNGRIYIGGTDRLYGVLLEINSSTFIIENTFVPYINETDECEYPSFSEHHRIFMVTSRQNEQLMVGGSGNCGKCYIYQKENFARTAEMNLFPSGRSNSRIPFSAFVYESHDGSLSGIMATTPNGSRDRRQLQIGINEHSDSLWHIARVLMGFSLDEYYYVLMLRRIDLRAHPSYRRLSTFLARISVNDTHIVDYSEIELRCSDTYRIGSFEAARTAAFGRGDIDHAMLYVVFEENDSSKVCSFNMTTTKEEFSFSEFSTGKNIKIDEYGMFKNVFKINICLSLHKDNGKFRCNFAIQKAVASFPSSTGIPVYKLVNDQITSIAAFSYKLKNLLFDTYNVDFIFGTAQSRLFKTTKSLTDSYVSYPNVFQYTVQYDPKTFGPFLPNPVFDSETETFYFLTMQSLTRVPIRSCSIFTGCDVCSQNDRMLYGDAFDCCWYRSECYHKSMLRSLEPIIKESKCEDCKPVVYDFSPKSGPIEGETRIVIHGYNLNYITFDQMNITISGRKCTYDYGNMNEINILRCRLNKRIGNETNKGELIVGVDQFEQIHYKIKGVTKAKNRFTFRKVSLFGIHPAYGPMMGGTVVVLVGENLNAGAEAKILFGQMECRILKRADNYTLCATDPHDLKEGFKTAFDVILEMNSFSYVLNRSESFTLSGENVFGHNFADNDAQLKEPSFSRFDYIDCMQKQSRLKFGTSFEYKPDPNLKKIYDENFGTDDMNRLKILESEQYFFIGDGVDHHTVAISGTKLFFEGEHLNSSNYPVLEVRDVLTQIRVNSSLCTALNATILSCIVPAYPDKIDKFENQISTYFLLHADGFTFNSSVPGSLTSYIYYHANPQFDQFKDTFQANFSFEADAWIVELRGSNLFTGLPYHIMLNDQLTCWVAKNISEEPDILRCFVRMHETKGENVWLQKKNLSVQLGEFIENTIGDVLLLKPEKPIFTWIELTIFLVVLLIAVTMTAIGIIFKYQQLKNIYILSRFRRHKKLEKYFEYAFDNQDLFNELKELGFVKKWENHVTKIEEKIGEGFFSYVFLGEDKDGRKVAIKMLKLDESKNYQYQLQALFLEVDAMKEFTHRNVLSLVGVTLLFHNNELQPALLLPYMSEGDLLSYLQRDMGISMRTLIEFAIQVAEGMEYLTGENFIHRDLAARNCLIGDVEGHLTIKIADFGLARQFLLDKNYYRTDLQNIHLPYRWIPLELFEGDDKMTLKSDVWSYGVLVWELLTRGHTPYAEWSDLEVAKYLQSGQRLPQPQYCPTLIYSIMLACWHTDPQVRPTFTELLAQLRHSLSLIGHDYVNLRKNATTDAGPCPFNYNTPNIQNIVNDYYLNCLARATQESAASTSYSLNGEFQDTAV